MVSGDMFGAIQRRNGSTKREVLRGAPREVEALKTRTIQRRTGSQNLKKRATTAQKDNEFRVEASPKPQNIIRFKSAIIQGCAESGTRRASERREGKREDAR